MIRWDSQRATREWFAAGTYRSEFTGGGAFSEPVVTAFNEYPAHARQRRESYLTPHGELTQTWELSPQAAADFLIEYYWKDWSHYDAIRYMLEAREYTFDVAEFEKWVRRIGDSGVVMVPFTQSPLKTFHWLAGQAQATLFMVDHPDQMQVLAAIHTRKALALLQTVVVHPDAQVFIALDNLDSAFYSPALYRAFCDDFFRRAAEIIHRENKHLVVHACGHGRVLLPLVGGSGVDCLEGLTPPPLGNVCLGSARKMAGSHNFTVNGGMDSPHQELQDSAERAIHEYTRNLFSEMGDKRHFVFASSCTTSVLTPWDNLKYFRDAARAYGGLG
jgi:uroporphyrinogen-III decarboxylase